MRTTLATAAVVGVLAVGGGALIAPSVASAQSADGQGRLGALASVLQDLVADGTLEKEQADKVADRLEATMPQRGGHMGGPRGGHMGGYMGGGGPGMPGHEAVAEALGMTVQELHEARHDDGGTLAEIAEAQGVSRAELVQRLVTAAAARLDQAVADERLTAEQAEERKSTLEQRISRLVDREPGPGRGRGPMHDD